MLTGGYITGKPIIYTNTPNENVDVDISREEFDIIYDSGKPLLCEVSVGSTFGTIITFYPTYSEGNKALVGNGVNIMDNVAINFMFTIFVSANGSCKSEYRTAV